MVEQWRLNLAYGWRAIVFNSLFPGNYRTTGSIEIISTKKRLNSQYFSKKFYKINPASVPADGFSLDINGNETSG
ncbi:hypothetical protein [Candidatus Methylobacter oryzae]|uniref:Uncharacterized protein n=1 Tax=Candidatus Methylobacter oryzae TaxID=2497749 RepID=A0ABY3C9W1_9GAMM|nr:hypothetical protein [Candidatus Methylobacter oryzae]TRW91202.1 hypothetical protein EKO24_017455 [Candidatus Methylobacter oryzae]